MSMSLEGTWRSSCLLKRCDDISTNINDRNSYYCNLDDKTTGQKEDTTDQIEVTNRRELFKDKLNNRFSPPRKTRQWLESREKIKDKRQRYFINDDETDEESSWEYEVVGDIDKPRGSNDTERSDNSKRRQTAAPLEPHDSERLAMLRKRRLSLSSSSGVSTYGKDMDDTSSNEACILCDSMTYERQYYLWKSPYTKSSFCNRCGDDNSGMRYISYWGTPTYEAGSWRKRFTAGRSADIDLTPLIDVLARIDNMNTSMGPIPKVISNTIAMDSNHNCEANTAKETKSNDTNTNSLRSHYMHNRNNHSNRHQTEDRGQTECLNSDKRLTKQSDSNMSLNNNSTVSLSPVSNYSYSDDSAVESTDYTDKKNRNNDEMFDDTASDGSIESIQASNPNNEIDSAVEQNLTKEQSLNEEHHYSVDNGMYEEFKAGLADESILKRRSTADNDIHRAKAGQQRCKRSLLCNANIDTDTITTESIENDRNTSLKCEVSVAMTEKRPRSLTTCDYISENDEMTIRATARRQRMADLKARIQTNVEEHLPTASFTGVENNNEMKMTNDSSLEQQHTPKVVERNWHNVTASLNDNLGNESLKEFDYLNIQNKIQGIDKCDQDTLPIQGNIDESCQYNNIINVVRCIPSATYASTTSDNYDMAIRAQRRRHRISDLKARDERCNINNNIKYSSSNDKKEIYTNVEQDHNERHTGEHNRIGEEDKGTVDVVQRNYLEQSALNHTSRTEIHKADVAETKSNLGAIRKKIQDLSETRNNATSKSEQKCELNSNTHITKGHFMSQYLQAAMPVTHSEESSSNNMTPQIILQSDKETKCNQVAHRHLVDKVTASQEENRKVAWTLASASGNETCSSDEECTSSSSKWLITDASNTTDTYNMSTFTEETDSFDYYTDQCDITHESTTDAVNRSSLDDNVMDTGPQTVSNKSISISEYVNCYGNNIYNSSADGQTNQLTETNDKIIARRRYTFSTNENDTYKVRDRRQSLEDLSPVSRYRRKYKLSAEIDNDEECMYNECDTSLQLDGSNQQEKELSWRTRGYNTDFFMSRQSVTGSEILDRYKKAMSSRLAKRQIKKQKSTGNDDRFTRARPSKFVTIMTDIGPSANDVKEVLQRADACSVRTSKRLEGQLEHRYS